MHEKRLPSISASVQLTVLLRETPAAYTSAAGVQVRLVQRKLHLSAFFWILLFMARSFSHTHRFARLPVSVSADKMDCSVAALTAKQQMRMSGHIYIFGLTNLTN